MNFSKIYTPITNSDIKKLNSARQIFSDCYLTSTLHSLSETKVGRKILQNNIQKAHTLEGVEFKIHLPNVNSKPKDVFVSEKEIDALYLVDKYCNVVEHGHEENPIQKAVEIAMNKLIKNNFFIKSLFSRFANSVEDFEYNSPSKFMKMFTGKQPLTLNENSLRMSLRSKQEEAMELLSKMDKTNGEYNIVAGTGAGAELFENWHCLSVTNVDFKNKHIKLYDTRAGQSQNISFDTFLKEFKYMTGFLSEDLK